MRWAAFLAFSTLSPASNTMSFNLAPPSALMPPALLTFSIARLAPLTIRSPCRAHGPDIGAIRPILISLVWAVTGAAARLSAAAAANKVRWMAVQVIISSRGRQQLVDPPPTLGLHGSVDLGAKKRAMRVNI